MKLIPLLREDRAVSPVIGVILMVAITVILAAVIGSFVLGLSDQVSTNAPSASFDFSYGTDNEGNSTVTITHNGGSTLNGAEIRITGIADSTAFTNERTYRAGDTLVSNAELEEDATRIRVIWNNPSGGSSAVIGSSLVPS